MILPPQYEICLIKYVNFQLMEKKNIKEPKFGITQIINQDCMKENVTT